MLQEVRLRNLRKLLQERGSITSLSRQLNLSPSHLYHILAGKLPLGDAAARGIERGLQLSSGALDEMSDKTEVIEAPILSLTQRITKPVQARRNIDGQVVDVAKAKVSTNVRNELIEGVLDHLETLAQRKGVSLLDHQKANLLKLAMKRLLANHT